MNADSKRAVIEAEASKHGFTLDRTDFRVGVFFIRRGDEVRRGWCWREIDLYYLRMQVRQAMEIGARMDRLEGSKYFAAWEK